MPHNSPTGVENVPFALPATGRSKVRRHIDTIFVHLIDCSAHAISLLASHAHNPLLHSLARLDEGRVRVKVCRVDATFTTLIKVEW